ncbi:MAG: hypothetical protein EA353_08820 [Puniceicoccaceae bacterium]|nr:MAG: hypothetical protein EA353_08820 [Puniceicoccaceae bacterium]
MRKINGFLGLKRASRHLWNRFSYAQLPTPEKAIFVNPSEINVVNKKFSTKDGLGQIVSGNWDLLELVPITDKNTFVGLNQRFVQGLEWSQTAYFEYARNKIEEKGHWWGYETLEQFLEIRCAYVDGLYHSIESKGYLSNEENGHTAPDMDHRMGSKRQRHSLEPLVLIDRNGDFQLRDGVHRVTLARILNIEKIPVHVLARHSTWVRARDKFLSGVKSSICNKDKLTMHNHPDISES